MEHVMSHQKLVVYFGVVMLLMGGCASNEVRTFFPPVGSEVIVKEELIATGSRLFIQNGQVRHRRDVSVGNPHCQFVLRRPRGETQEFIIQPQTFSVTRTFREVTRGSVNMTLSTFMDLAPESQPEVNQLVCQRWGSRKLDGFVTIKEMKTTLSPIVELVLGAE
jgi:hypothetical protein